MAEFSSKCKDIIFYIIVESECKPSLSPSPQPHINFNISYKSVNLNWVEDQDSIRFLSQGDSTSFDETAAVAVANVDNFSIEEIIQPIKNVLEHGYLLPELWHDQFIEFAWKDLSELRPQLAAGCCIVDLGIEVFIQHHLVTVGENVCSRESSCCICLEDLSDDRDKLRLGLPCSHVFHLDCSEKWLKKSSSCPFCRRGVPPLSDFLSYLLRGRDLITTK